MSTHTHPLPNSTLGRCMALCMALLLTRCAAPGASVDTTPLNAQNVCSTKASLVNPAMAAAAGGIGGTGISTGGIGGTGAPRTDVLVGRPGIGGTGIGTGGIGGTGAPRTDVVVGRPGIGGTGIDTGGIGGTGIVGVITGFASVCVNGVEVLYDANTPVLANGQATTASELSVGQVVALQASASGSGAQLTARSIGVIYAAVGPLSSVDTGTGKLELLGQTVRTATADAVPGLKAGDWVRVSGYRLVSGDVAASRIEPVAAQAQAQVTGPISQLDANGFMLQAARVQLGNLSLPQGAAPGNEVSVRGQWDGNSLRAQDLHLEPTLASVGAVGTLVIEGYVHALKGRELRIGDRVVTLQSNAKISGNTQLAVDQRVQVIGRLDSDRRFSASRVDVRGDSSGNSDGRGGKGSSGKGRGGSSDDRDSSGKSESGSGKGSSGSDSSGSDSSGSDSSGSGSSGSGSSGSGSSGSGSSGSGSSGKGSSGGGKGK